MKRILHIVLVLLAAAACQGPRVIPKDTLTDIYVDMFMVDQQIREENVPRPKMDTTLVYEAVFNKYGYDTDDYLHSVREYLKDPERFAKVFEEVAKRLEGEAKALEKIIEHEEWVAKRMGAKRPQIDSVLAPFSKESIFLGLARAVADTSRYAAWFRLVAVQEDTLMISVDSLEAMAARDSLKAAADSLVKDSVKVGLPAPTVDKSKEKPLVSPAAGEKLKPMRMRERELEVEVPAEEAVEEDDE